MGSRIPAFRQVAIPMHPAQAVKRDESANDASHGRVREQPLGRPAMPSQVRLHRAYRSASMPSASESMPCASITRRGKEDVRALLYNCGRLLQPMQHWQNTQPRFGRPLPTQSGLTKRKGQQALQQKGQQKGSTRGSTRGSTWAENGQQMDKKTSAKANARGGSVIGDR